MSIVKFPSTEYFYWFWLAGDAAPRSSSVEGNQWSYDLPHSLINETLDLPSKQGRRLESSQRRPKLTVGFAQDLGVYRGDKGAESKAAIAGHDYRFNRIHKHGDDESSRGLSPEAIAKITETLGAINTVGRYLVNYTKGAASPTDLFTHEDQQASPVRTQTFDTFVAFATTVRPW